MTDISEPISRNSRSSKIRPENSEERTAKADPGPFGSSAANRFDHPPSVFDRFDIRWAEAIWVFNNVRGGSRVVAIGIEANRLRLLKKKDVQVNYVYDWTRPLQDAHQSKYESTLYADSFQLPFQDGAFDYVILSDLFEAGPEATDERVIVEFKRVLAPGGQVLLGNRCSHSSSVSTRTHQGSLIEAAFKRHFSYVETKYRLDIVRPVSDLIREFEHSGDADFNRELISYFKRLEPGEERAFNIAMGMVFGRLLERDVKISDGDYVLLKATDREPRSFHNEHPASYLITPGIARRHERKSISLDTSPDALFDNGFYPRENLPPESRWMGQVGRIHFRAEGWAHLRLSMMTNMPDLGRNPISVEIRLNQLLVNAITIIDRGWLDVEIHGTDLIPNDDCDWVLEIHSSRVWVPNYYDSADPDDRELSVAICNLELYF